VRWAAVSELQLSGLRTARPTAQLVVITPREVPDAYDNPTPALDYGPDAPRRAGAGLLPPRDSGRGTDPSPGLAPVTGV
jgi:hypothetical protein